MKRVQESGSRMSGSPKSGKSNIKYNLSVFQTFRLSVFATLSFDQFQRDHEKIIFPLPLVDPICKIPVQGHNTIVYKVREYPVFNGFTLF